MQIHTLARPLLRRVTLRPSLPKVYKYLNIEADVFSMCQNQTQFRLTGYINSTADSHDVPIIAEFL